MATKLRQAREQEGLSRPELAREAEVADKTLQRAEAGEKLAPRTRHKILNGFNRRPTRLRTYEMKDLFPQEEDE
jgi:DNA-binding XRE family transcriptional regulator